ncbi:MAG: MFS transporter [Paludibacteraceae bacterium]|nr:MFS transporter [Paludibacteraceae bacterium]
MSTQKKLMTNWRWWLCSLLFVATTVNYLDRQVLSLTYEEFIKPEFHWTDSDYGTITSLFSIFYAIACLFAGKFVDWMGTKKGYLWAIGVWSAGACLHAACGWATAQIEGLESVAAMRAVEAGSNVALAVATTSVYLFLLCRGILALGEAGNFPAAIKVTAEYFPKKDRAFATSLFNAGASVGALAAPLCIPPLAKHLGWEMAFIIIGALGFIWMFFWQFMYDKPEKSKHVNEAELAYIHQDDEAEAEAAKANAQTEEKAIPMMKCFGYRQTWAFIVGKFFTDGVWWFFLFWAPSYFQNQFGYKASDPMGQALIFTLYAIVTIISIGGGYLPKLFVERRGMEPYSGRMLSMLLFAFFPLVALLAQPLGAHSAWWPAVLIGLAGAGHQAWSANLFSTIGDMFPKSTIATITGIGAMAGGIGSMIIQKSAGALFTYAEEAGAAFTFFGFEGKPAGYFIMFCFCGLAYIIAWGIMKLLVPHYKPIKA